MVLCIPLASALAETLHSVDIEASQDCLTSNKASSALAACSSPFYFLTLRVFPPDVAPETL